MDGVTFLALTRPQTKHGGIDERKKWLNGAEATAF